MAALDLERWTQSEADCLGRPPPSEPNHPEAHTRNGTNAGQGISTCSDACCMPVRITSTWGCPRSPCCRDAQTAKFHRPRRQAGGMEAKVSNCLRLSTLGGAEVVRSMELNLDPRGKGGPRRLGCDATINQPCPSGQIISPSMDIRCEDPSRCRRQFGLSLGAQMSSRRARMKPPQLLASPRPDAARSEGQPLPQMSQSIV